jgi:hypothetical protein
VKNKDVYVSEAAYKLPVAYFFSSSHHHQYYRKHADYEIGSVPVGSKFINENSINVLTVDPTQRIANTHAILKRSLFFCLLN